jgi:hypothetical protein
MPDTPVAFYLTIAGLVAAPALAGEMNMPGLFGPYGMSREASGTSWQPDSTATDGVHVMSGAWTTMWHGNLAGVYTESTGPRGDHESFNESMLMFMGRRALDSGALGVRAMVSLEPLMGPRGYPLLFQTGETADGVHPLIDRQHPHNLLMELSASYTKTLTQDSSVFLYGGPVGEPALGPPAYMHRFSSQDDPEAPLAHHWLDATHISFGVVTVGGIWRRWKLEGSVFNGREPDEHRYGLQFRSLDSTALRISYNPDPHWSLQVSTGRLASPEQLQPDTDVRRTTASAIYDVSTDALHWQTTLAWGRNSPGGASRTDGYLLDSAIQFAVRHTLFGRLEQVGKDELFPAGAPLDGRQFPIKKISAGYVYEFSRLGHLRFGIGGVVSRHFIPADLDAAYGAHPSSYSVFVRTRLVP